MLTLRQLVRLWQRCKTDVNIDDVTRRQTLPIVETLIRATPQAAESAGTEFTRILDREFNLFSMMARGAKRTPDTERWAGAHFFTALIRAAEGSLTSLKRKSSSAAGGKKGGKTKSDRANAKWGRVDRLAIEIMTRRNPPVNPNRLLTAVERELTKQAAASAVEVADNDVPSKSTIGRRIGTLIKERKIKFPM
jgi:hypothetical protein